MPESMEDEIMRRKGLKPMEKEAEGPKKEAEGPKQRWGEARAKRFAGQHPNVMSLFRGVKKIGGIMAKPVIDAARRDNEQNKAYHEALKKELPKAAKEKAKADAKKIMIRSGPFDFNMNGALFGNQATQPAIKKTTITISETEEKKKKSLNLFGDGPF